MKKESANTVYLVGAGPGDPDLLTIKARRLLTECDALIYDALIPKEILNLANCSCRRFFVGKRRGKHSLSQDQINKLLAEISKDYSCVVRLKGGDPFLFGRGSEEADFLAQQKVKVQVVPGITSGMAVPAYIGIPVTHRKAGSSVTFVTGHEGGNKKDPSVNWRALAKSTDSLVIYMGMQNLDHIVKELIAGGLNPETPSAIIHQGTLTCQRHIKCSLSKLTSQHTAPFPSPSIVIIGKVVNYQIEECSPLIEDLNMYKSNQLIQTGKENKLNQLLNSTTVPS